MNVSLLVYCLLVALALDSFLINVSANVLDLLDCVSMHRAKMLSTVEQDFVIETHRQSQLDRQEVRYLAQVTR
jgi:hypothetical protein